MLCDIDAQQCNKMHCRDRTPVLCIVMIYKKKYRRDLLEECTLCVQYIRKDYRSTIDILAYTTCRHIGYSIYRTEIRTNLTPIQEAKTTKMHFGGQNILEFHILVRCVQTQTLISKAAHSLLLNPEKGMRRLTNQTEPALCLQLLC